MKDVSTSEIPKAKDASTSEVPKDLTVITQITGVRYEAVLRRLKVTAADSRQASVGTVYGLQTMQRGIARDPMDPYGSLLVDSKKGLIGALPLSLVP